MLRELYNGKVIPWERHNRYAAEQLEILHKIESEEKYFTTKMQAEDCERLKALFNLYSELSIIDEGEIFAYGFSVGLLIMADSIKEAKSMFLKADNK